MRLKTFIATYLLFLFVLYTSLGIVSVYMTKSQTDMLKEKSAGEYHSIAAALVKDIAVLYGRSAGFSGVNDYGINGDDSVNSLVNGYKQYYGRYNIMIDLTELSLSAQNGDDNMDTEMSFVRREQGHFIRITGMLPDPFRFYQLDYSLDITKNISDMQNIQKTLLIFAVIFSMLTAAALYFILLGVFKPLGMVAETSRKIADGQYCERVYIKGKHELAAMASDFNRMAEIIEKQICFLENEAIGKQQFADNFAHEIRTPLTSIYGYAEYMQKAPLDEKEIIESAQYIMDEASNMKHIADSLLELATLRDYRPLKNEIPVPRLFDEISRSLEKPLREHRVRLISRSDADLLFGQEDLIKSLLVNLCHNALKSCAPDTGEVCLIAETRGGKTVLSVTDNGCGIPEESIAKVTAPFYRADKARSREQGGAGLGLTLCGQIAEAHDAEMTIESVVGLGTTVKITFTSS